MLLKAIILSILAINLKAQLCINMEGGCGETLEQESNCMNSICQQCDNGNDVKSDCKCPISQYWSEDDNGCLLCHESCLNCSGPESNQCLDCAVKEGFGLDHENNECICIFGYKITGDYQNPCRPCYIHGNKCLDSCPDGTKPNHKIMSCERFADDPLENNDDTVYITIMIILIIIAVLLTYLLYYYFHAMFKKIWLQEKDRFQPLSEEEKQYLTQIVQIEEKRKEQAEKRDRDRELEKQRQKEEQERLEKERLEAEKRRLEEEEAERRRQQEEEERRLEEERLRQLAEAEALREMELEKERLEKERQERERREREEMERVRQKNEAIKARNQRKMERQLTRQATMAANEEKLRKMREQRQLNIQEKEEMEQHNERCLQDAERIDEKKDTINKKLEKARFRRQETMSVKQGIMNREATIASKRKELDTELEGIDFNAAIQKVQDIQSEDVVFLQNLRSPPERIKLCLEAVVMLLKNTTKAQDWDDVRKDISDLQFRRKVLTYDPEQMSDKIYNKISKEYTNNPKWNLIKIFKASPAAGAFAEWLDASILYKKIKVENAGLFQKVKDLKIEEAAMQEDLDKLEGLEQEEEECKNEEDQMEKEMNSINDKQLTLRKQATLNLGDIQEREENIKKLNTGDLSLEAIPESEEEEDSGSDLSPEEAEILKNLNL